MRLQSPPLLSILALLQSLLTTAIPAPPSRISAVLHDPRAWADHVFFIKETHWQDPSYLKSLSEILGQYALVPRNFHVHKVFSAHVGTVAIQLTTPFYNTEETKEMKRAVRRQHGIGLLGISNTFHSPGGLTRSRKGSGDGSQEGQEEDEEEEEEKEEQPNEDPNDEMDIDMLASVDPVSKKPEIRPSFPRTVQRLSRRRQWRGHKNSLVSTNGTMGRIGIEKTGMEPSPTDQDQLPIFNTNIQFREAWPELEIVSHPPDMHPQVISTPPFYNFENPGKGVHVYVVDTGCDYGHPEMSSIHRCYHILVGGVPAETVDDDGSPWRPSAPKYHGTRVTAKVAGRLAGVATDATIVSVKLLDAYGDIKSLAPLEGLLKIYDQAQMLAGREVQKQRFVINMAVELKLDPERRFSKMFEETSLIVFKKIQELGGIVVVGAGNAKAGTPITRWPAVLARRDEMKQIIIPVAGFDVKTGENIFQYEPWIHIAAPGRKLWLPSPKNKDEADLNSVWTKGGYSEGQGTSFAAPQVAGMLANFIALGIREPLGLLLRLAHPRGEGMPTLLFSGITQDMRKTAIETGPVELPKPEDEEEEYENEDDDAMEVDDWETLWPN